MGGSDWRSLNTPSSELRLEFTLPTGQSFRWRQTGPLEFTGVIQQRVVQMRQEQDDVAFRVLARGEGAHVAQDEAALHDYFNLGTSLAELSLQWAQGDARFRKICPYYPGARVLRQDPVECLFQFVCSSNNHISRIHGMVERLCRAYGTRLPVVASAADAAAALPEDLAFYAFPTLQQLQEATDEALRSEGFGYRAKFIVGSVAALMAQDGGGAAWLQGLRGVSYPEASEALCALPGVGPKVAACVCLFSLDKHAAIPVDTHVWQLASKYYTPHLKGKTLTKPVMAAVEAALQQRFGSHAGWAHNALFISELASHRHHLPPHLQPPGRGQAGAAARSASAPAALLSEAAADQGALERPVGEALVDAATRGAAAADGGGGAAVQAGRQGRRAARPRQEAGAAPEAARPPALKRRKRSAPASAAAPAAAEAAQLAGLPVGVPQESPARDAALGLHTPATCAAEPVVDTLSAQTMQCGVIRAEPLKQVLISAVRSGQGPMTEWRRRKTQPAGVRALCLD